MLSVTEYEDILLRISSASDIVSVNDGSKDIFVVFKNTTNSHRLRAQIIYNTAYKNALKIGLLKSEDLEKLLDDKNVISESDNKELDSLKGKIEAQKLLLAKTTKVKANRDKIKKNIINFEEKISEIKYKKMSKMTMSAEAKAEEEKISYLCWASTFRFDIDDVLFWSSYDSFLNERNLNLRNSILISFINFHRGIDTSKIRYIARSALWRIRYITSQKTSDPLFGLPATEYTNDMLNLAYWTNYYNNIYEMMPEDRPSDEVIEDDDALDAFMDKYYKDKEREYSKRKLKKSGNKLSASDHEEVIITRSNELYEEVTYDKPKEYRRYKEAKNIVADGKKNKRR